MISNKKVIIIIGIISVFVFTSIIINSIFLKEENKTKIIKQKNTIGIIVEGQEQEEFPSKQDYEFEKAVCNGLEVEASDTGIDSFNIVIQNLDKTSNCVFYFIEVFEYTETLTYLSDQAQTWNVPKTGKYKVELWGSQSISEQNCVTDQCNLMPKPAGGYTSGEIVLEKNQTYYFYIGNSSTFNGGISGPIGVSGGATDMRTINGTWNNNSSLISRIMVAGGAGTLNIDAASYFGSNTYYSTTYFGGTLNSGTSTTYIARYGNTLGYSGLEGTQTSGGLGGQYGYYYSLKGQSGTNGSFGKGGTGGTGTNTRGHGGSGGGGYYGGGGSGSAWYSDSTNYGEGNAGGGGSSFISGHTGCVAVTLSGEPKIGCATGTTDNLCSIHNSSLKFSQTKVIDGAGNTWTNIKSAKEAMPNPLGGYYDLGKGHTGNGYARITYIP